MNHNHCLVGAQTWELNLDKFLRVKGSVVISGSAERSWKSSTWSVDSLPLVSKIDSSGDFSDENRSHFFLSVVLMNTQVVDFGHLNLIIFDMCKYWYSRNTGYKLLFGIPNTHQPLRLISGGSECPFKKLPGIVKPKGIIIILDIIIG